MDIDMRTEKQYAKNTVPSAMNCLAGEHMFELSLQTMVTGTCLSGDNIQEFTKLSSISSEMATFFLKSRVKPGSKLTLSLEVPKTPILEKPLKLIVRGDVLSSNSDDKTPERYCISLQLDKSFKIQPYR